MNHLGRVDAAASGSFAAYVTADVRAVAQTLAMRNGVRPLVIGASLGGISALLAQGDAQARGESPLFDANAREL